MKYNIRPNPFVHSRLLPVLARMPYSDFIRKLHDRAKLFWHGNVAGYTYPDINKTRAWGGGSIHFGTRQAALHRALHLKYGLHKHQIDDLIKYGNFDTDSYSFSKSRSKALEAANRLYPSYNLDKTPPNTHYSSSDDYSYSTHPIKLTPYIIKDPGRKGFANFEKYDNSKTFQDGEGYPLDDPDSAANDYLNVSNRVFKRFKKINKKNIRKVVIYPNQEEDEGSRSIAVTDPNYAMPYRDVVRKYGDLDRSMKTGDLTKSAQYRNAISNYHKYKFESTFYSKLEKIILESLSSF